MDRNKRTLMRDGFINNQKTYNYESYKNLGWMKRALNAKTPMTADNESIRTRVEYYEGPDKNLKGKVIVFPTIRMENGALKKYTSIREAMDQALNKKDFVVFESINEGNNFSKGLSAYISKLRN